MQSISKKLFGGRGGTKNKRKKIRKWNKIERGYKKENEKKMKLKWNRNWIAKQFYSKKKRILEKTKKHQNGAWRMVIKWKKILNLTHSSWSKDYIINL